MPKQRDRTAKVHRSYLKCTDCGHVAAVDTVPFSIVKPRRAVSCECEEFNGVVIPDEDGFDALVRQELEAA
ncbi:hypothetical protein EVB78_143 [Rhizobium phage RHph_N1_15]|nr:hypothetical protein EVB77_143 [Rhizobium phage RHph_N1_10]QIG69345.1 hypothetical protein EVB78_143 [Rhizobium phage RHph_N1_15]QIG75205.1 hypothetical protein EVC15_143 [Rhizobium phage RHph_N2_6]